MLKIEPFKQSDDSLCGPAVIKMVLQYNGIDAPESEIAERAGHTYALGCDDQGMKKALESYGLSVNIKNFSTFDDIQKLLDQKIPIIVDWFSGGVNCEPFDTPNGHSSIVVDLNNTHIFLFDPELGYIRELLKDDFMRCWFDWRSPYLVSWDDMIIRQTMVAYKT